MSDRFVRTSISVLIVTVGVTDLLAAAVPGSRRALIATSASPLSGGRYLLLLVAVLVLASIWGLRRGQRTAWWLAMVACAGSLLVHHHHRVDHVATALAALAVLALLLTRRHFRSHSEPLRARAGWRFLALGELGVLAYGVVGLYLLDEEFRDATTIGQSFVQATRLLFLLPTSTIEPVTLHGSWFIESVRFLSLLVVIVAVVRLLVPVLTGPVRERHEHERAARLVDEWARSTLTPFALGHDKHLYFSEDDEAFLAYRLVRHTAVVLGGPIGRPSSRRRLIAEFLDHCDLNAWTVAFHQATAEEADELASHGLRALKIGEEAVVSTIGFSLDGRHFKSLRSSLARVRNAGHRVEELAQPIDDETMAELRDVSDSWIAASGHRERTFTVGQFDPTYLRETRVLVVRDPAERIVAFVNLLPSYQTGVGNFDLMRRRPDSTNGVMEYLFVAMIERFRDEGKVGMSLGLAPLAGLEGGGVAARVLRAVRDNFGSTFNFVGLHEFKAKWRPDWQPRYEVYRCESDLPRVAAAVAVVGELPEPASVNPLRRLARAYPVTLALGGLALWVMVATAIDTDLHQVLIRYLGLSWPDLVHLQWWRVFTNQLIQTRPGVVWSNVALLAVLLPLAERRSGSRRTLLTFFVGDVVSTLLLLVGLRMASALGSAEAWALVTQQDGGTSSGCFALAAMLSWSMSRRRRLFAMAALIAWSSVGYVMFGDLFHLAHLGASVVGFLLGWWWADRGVISSPQGHLPALDRSGSAGTPPTSASATYAPSTEVG